MKTAAKVFLIISMVAGGIGFLFGIVALTNPTLAKSLADFGLTGVNFIVQGILSLTFGSIALYKLGKACTQRELVPWGVCALLFCSLLSGIFLLLVKDEELAPTTLQANPFEATTESQDPFDEPKEKEEKLEEPFDI